MDRGEPVGTDSDRSPRWQAPAGAVLVAMVVLLVVFAPSWVGTDVGWREAAVLGTVEGMTEYLPVSSTGHLAVVSELFWSDADPQLQEALDSYLIVIQAGAILAVVGLYRSRFVEIARGVVAGGTGRRMAAALVVAFLPAAVVGVLVGDLVKERLFGLIPIALAWVVGGVVILVVDHRLMAHEGAQLEGITMTHAWWIGIAQVLALWPGTSRSLVTILGGRAAGLSTGAAVEFSFLLGAVTLLAASFYEGARSIDSIFAAIGPGPALVGFAAATISAALAARWLVGYLSRHSLAGFGWYRIVLGVGVLVLAAL